MTEAISVMIVDDHRMVREGLKSFMRPIPDMKIIAEAEDGAQAVELALSLNPDVILLDLVLPKMDGIEAAKAICEHNKNARILMITSFSEDEKVTAAVRAGVCGYLLKDSSPQELETAIREVSRGEYYFPDGITRVLVQSIHQPGRRSDPLEALTPREMEVLSQVAKGLSNKDIAEILFLSPWTVRSHLWHIMNKLELENRTQLTLFAVRCGLSGSVDN